jgi:hypothetical protein
MVSCSQPLRRILCISRKISTRSTVPSSASGTLPRLAPITVAPPSPTHSRAWPGSVPAASRSVAM